MKNHRATVTSVPGIICFISTAYRMTVVTPMRIMMTSSNGNIFQVTSPLCGEFTSDRWIPLQRRVMRSFNVFFDLRLNKREAGNLRRHRAHYDATVMMPLVSGIDVHYIPQVVHTDCNGLCFVVILVHFIHTLLGCFTGTRGNQGFANCLTLNKHQVIIWTVDFPTNRRMCISHWFSTMLTYCFLWCLSKLFTMTS